MQDINQLEKEKIYQWACDNYTEEIKEKYFTKIDRECDSYFESRIYSEKYCREYSFQTVVDMRNVLSELWRDDVIMEKVSQIVLVASMKNKPSREKGRHSENTLGEKETIKPYVYNF